MSKFPENMGKPWENEEQIKLREELCSNNSIELIAKLHKRTENGILCEIKREIYNFYKEGKNIEELKKIFNLEKEFIEKTIRIKEKNSKNIKKENPIVENKITHIFEEESIEKRLERIELKVDKILEYLKISNKN